MADSSPLTEALVDLFEPLFYGCLMCIFLFGVCVVQTWTYIKHNHNTRPLQAVIAIMFGMVFACAVLNGQIIHFYLVRLLRVPFGVARLELPQLKNFGNFLAVTRISKEVSMVTLLSVLITVIADLCFATRIWRLQRVHFGIIVLIILTAIACLVSGASKVFERFRNHEDLNRSSVLVNQILEVPLVSNLTNSKHKTAVATINFMAAASQGISTFALWYSFKAHMDEASQYVPSSSPLSLFSLNVGNRKSTPQAILKRLTRGVLIRGGVLTLAQLLIGALFLAGPDKLWWMPLHQVLAPLYYMTTVTMLNKRRAPSHDTSADLEFSTISGMKRHDSVLAKSNYSPINPTRTDHANPFSSHGGLTPFVDLHSSDSNVLAPRKRLCQESPVVNGGQREQWTPRASTTDKPPRGLPTFGSTPSNSDRDLIRPISPKGKGRKSYDGTFEAQKIRKLPAAPGAAMLNHSR
ncbi:hypothetical protein V5O48_008831 [Marasmius crinis-equi]|uniref:Uncharacterized protein n=1 Tax=Marasmius crinis-equi TaxID=585013 RepID=A0ABR3FCT0_9AGAR